PLLVHGRAVGVMIYMSTEKDTFTPEFVGLLQRLADNVSFALEDHRGRGAVALDPSRSRPGAAGSVHRARRGNRADRADRPLGAEGSLCAEHGLAAPRPAAGDHGGQFVAAAIRRRAPVAGC